MPDPTADDRMTDDEAADAYMAALAELERNPWRERAEAAEARVAELEEAMRRIYRDRGERDKVFMEATRVMPDLARFQTLREEVAAEGERRG